MQLSRVNFGQAVQIGIGAKGGTYARVDLARSEFKDFVIELDTATSLVKISSPSNNVVLVPLGNVAYMELKADVTRSEISKDPQGVRPEGKGKTRAT